MDYLKEYYESRDEDSRLTSRHGSVEYITSMKYIHECAAKCGAEKILDVGAGTGRYSVALAEEGFDVTAIELLGRNLDVLKGKIRGGVKLAAHEGNALDLSRFGDGEFDMTLLFGPMYHLYSESDKRRALAEAVRVTRRGGYVLVAYCMNEPTVVSFVFRRGGLREVLENNMLEKGGVSVTRSGGYSSSDADDKDGAKVSRKVLKDYYAHIREEEEKAHADRVREAVSSIPGMEEIFERESSLGAAITSFAPGSGAAGSLEQIRNERKEIEESKKSLLRSAGYPTDYLERKYRCNICKDTGYTDEGKVCSCCRARADEAYMWIREKQN